jgi:hypothetical protein
MEERVLAVLGQGQGEPAWLELIKIFDSAPEVFYELASGTLGSESQPRVRSLSLLAALVRDAITGTYEIADSTQGPTLITYGGKKVLIPVELLQQVSDFLRAVDGKQSAVKSGRDYEGQRASAAEARFKLGDPDSWAGERAQLESRRRSKPQVLKLDDDDLEHLASQPQYVTYGLMNCARQVVLSPTSVFKGLARGDDASPTVNDGWIFCGRPRRTFDNSGTPGPAPAGMVYLVFADTDNCVFDWDWVAEDSSEPGYPRDWRLRFGNPHPLDVDVVLNLPGSLAPGRFDSTRACYSKRGDCIFCYMTGEESYAERVNSDLTVFRDLKTDVYTGFKIKNVRRILKQDKSIKLSDAPGLSVSVDSVLLATLKLHRDAAIEVYQVLIKALYKKAEEPPRVHVPPEIIELVNS